MFVIALALPNNKEDEKTLTDQGFIRIQTPLSIGLNDKPIYLWYKEGNDTAITRIQFSFNDETAKTLSSFGYCKIDKNLNPGLPGDAIYLWYYKGETPADVGITKLDISINPDDQKLENGWELRDCDLIPETGRKINFLWLKREKQMFLKRITATDTTDGDQDFLEQGYVRVDESTNRGTGGKNVFIWYLQTTDPKEAITDLKISHNALEEDKYQKQGYIKVIPPLNEGSGDHDVFLWFKKVYGDDPIKAVAVILMGLLENEVKKLIISFWPPSTMYLCYSK